MRPIVSFTNSKWYKLVKCVATILFQEIDFGPSCIVAMHKLVVPKNYSIMFSIDFVSMYTNIDLHFALQQLWKCMPEQLKGWHSFIEYMLFNSIVKLEGDFFRFTNGIPMGNPLSPLLANLSLLDWDTQLRNNHPSVIFYRYLDDVLVACNSWHDAYVWLLDAKEHLPLGLEYTLDLRQPVKFLDRLIYPEGRIVPALKQLNMYNYPSFNSLHRFSCKKGFIVGEFLRAMRIASDLADPLLWLTLVKLKCIFEVKLFYPRTFVLDCLEYALNRLINPKIVEESEQANFYLKVPSAFPKQYVDRVISFLQTTRYKDIPITTCWINGKSRKRIILQGIVDASS